MKESSWHNKIETLIGVIILLVIWQVVAIKINNPIYLPTLGEVLKSLLETVQEKYFLLQVGTSLFRCLVSFIIALILGTILGVISSISGFFRNLLKPINFLAMSIPTMILVVLAVIWFDKNDTPFIVGIAIVFPIIYDAVVSSILSIDKNILEMLKVYKVPLIEKIRKIYIPTIKFQIVGILVSTFSLALKVVIAGEVYGQPSYGMGTVIQIEKMNFNTQGIFAWIIIIAIISVFLDFLNKFIKNIVFRWQRQ